MYNKLTQISSKIRYPKPYFNQIQRAHAKIVDAALKVTDHSRTTKNNILHWLNGVAYKIMINDYIDESLFENIDFSNDLDLSESDYHDLLVKHEVLIEDLIWDWPDLDYQDNDNTKKSSTSDSNSPDSIESSESEIISVNENSIESSTVQDNQSVQDISHSMNSYCDLIPAGNSDIKKSENSYDIEKRKLYLEGPEIPQFDVTKPWVAGNDGTDNLIIYTSLPIVPLNQCDISVTTDINLMNDADFLKLFPNLTIHTRAASMYDNSNIPSNCTYDDLVGIVFPIEGFTLNEVKSNIIEYPHLYQLMKCIGNKYANFYASVEIDGKLHKITDIWNELDDTSKLPKTKDFMKEYVVRRYLLERDIKHIEHRYPMWGSLGRFLTLFTTRNRYELCGYDSLEISKQCVNSRIEYYRTRNPILRRLGYYA